MNTKPTYASNSLPDNALGHLKAVNRSLFLCLHDDDDYWLNQLLMERPDLRADDLMKPGEFDLRLDLDDMVQQVATNKQLFLFTGGEVRSQMMLNADEPTQELDIALQEMARTYALCFGVISFKQAVRSMARQFGWKVNLLSQDAFDPTLHPSNEELAREALALGFSFAWPDSLRDRLDAKLDRIRNYRRFAPYRWYKQIQAA